MHPRHRQPSRRAGSPGNLVVGALASAVAGAAVFAAAAVHSVEPSAAPGLAVGAPAPHTAPQPLSQVGTLVAVSDDSVTARSTNGFTRTYRLTPSTAAITSSGGQGPVRSRFAVDDPVTIVGVLSDGDPVATAVADQTVAGLAGPPMDVDG